jgi:hypothetical protein
MESDITISLAWLVIGLFWGIFFTTLYLKRKVR